MGPQLAAALTLITQACLDWEYYPQAFKTARTRALRNLGKGDYQAPKSWRPIALLETLGKVVESVIAVRIREFAGTAGLLPGTQMGARKGPSTEKALAMLLARIRATCISGAFNRVLKERLTWVLCKQGLPRAVYNWVLSFMSNQQTTLAFDGKESPVFPVLTGIS